MLSRLRKLTQQRLDVGRTQKLIAFLGVASLLFLFLLVAEADEPAYRGAGNEDIPSFLHANLYSIFSSPSSPSSKGPTDSATLEYRNLPLNPCKHGLTTETRRLSDNDKYRPGKPHKVYVAAISSPSGAARRTTLRQTVLAEWPKTHYNFFIGSQGLAPPVIEMLQKENDEFGDLVMLDMKDTYLNLTEKMAHTFRWVSSQNRKDIDIVLKMDDDVYGELNGFVRLLGARQVPYRKTYIGRMYHFPFPSRSGDGKWVMTREQYPWSMYGPYNTGPLYALSVDVAALFADAYFNPDSGLPRIPWEDTSVGFGVCMAERPFDIVWHPIANLYADLETRPCNHDAHFYHRVPDDMMHAAYKLSIPVCRLLIRKDILLTLGTGTAEERSPFHLVYMSRNDINPFEELPSFGTWHAIPSTRRVTQPVANPFNAPNSVGANGQAVIAAAVPTTALNRQGNVMPPSVDNGPRYLLYQPPHAGIHNQLLSVMDAMAFALALNRTLVLAPIKLEEDVRKALCSGGILPSKSRVCKAGIIESVTFSRDLLDFRRLQAVMDVVFHEDFVSKVYPKMRESVQRVHLRVPSGVYQEKFDHFAKDFPGVERADEIYEVDSTDGPLDAAEIFERFAPYQHFRYLQIDMLFGNYDFPGDQHLFYRISDMFQPVHSSDVIFNEAWHYLRDEMHHRPFIGFHFRKMTSFDHHCKVYSKDEAERKHCDADISDVYSKLVQVCLKTGVSDIFVATDPRGQETVEQMEKDLSTYGIRLHFYPSKGKKMPGFDPKSKGVSWLRQVLMQREILSLSDYFIGNRWSTMSGFTMIQRTLSGKSHTTFYF